MARRPLSAMGSGFLLTRAGVSLLPCEWIGLLRASPAPQGRLLILNQNRLHLRMPQEPAPCPLKERHLGGVLRLDPHRRTQLLLRHAAAPGVAAFACWNFREWAARCP